MVLGALGKLFTTTPEQVAKKFHSEVEKVNELEPSFEKLSDNQLRGKTQEFRKRLESGEELDDLLPEAFAAVREASRRTTGLRHFDVQLIGGVVLHQGKVAEMKTGEGKTLVAPLPLYLNALEGKGCHLVTVNDYLSKRDTQWMGPIYHLLGLTVGCLQHEASLLFDSDFVSDNPSTNRLRSVSRREAYHADITYGTNHEFGFDYLRDNMATELSQQVQRELHYAIVDEVDYILIDEARTPLIISGPAQESTQHYQTMARLVPRLQVDEDFTTDEKHRSVGLTDEGIDKMEKWLNVGNLYDPENTLLIHHIENGLRALVHFRRDRDYVVKDRAVIIVDEFTGRLMSGRRWSEGLHQAVEAKEGVKIERETITYATVTLQNYFRMYHKLAGMTGTAATEAEEFLKIYRLDVVPIPTHRPMIRHEFPDLVYSTEKGKWQAVAREIERLHETSQPVLVGTTSIEKSDLLSDMLGKSRIPHQILNAKFHEKEASIVAQAGRLEAVTVATNMAGRGTDIILGGNPDGLLQEELRKQGHTIDSAPPELVGRLREEIMAGWQEEHDKVVELGGLHVLGTEKHEARRIDNQLRGRSGRQGDPGSSRFYVALDDDLMRRFGGERIKGLMNWAGFAEDQALENAMVTRSIEGSQVKVEGYNFEIRKHLVEYDDVVNKHRDVIYTERRKILSGADLKANILAVVEQELTHIVNTYLEGNDWETWDFEGLVNEVQTIFPLPPELRKHDLEPMNREEAQEALISYAQYLYDKQEQTIGAEDMRRIEHWVMLRVLDIHWVEHLTSMDNLRQGVGLQSVGQRDPLVTYRAEGYAKFQETLARIQHDIARTIYHANLVAERQPAVSRVAKLSPMASVAGGRRIDSGAAPGNKIGRNEPCPCGSGKKYKRCHGAAA